MKALLLVSLVGLSACSWFGARKVHPADPAQLIVTGAPAGSVLFVDGVQLGQAAVLGDHPQVIDVPAGVHKVEIRVGDAIVYREEPYVSLGQHRVVTVLSGSTR